MFMEAPGEAAKAPVDVSAQQADPSIHPSIHQSFIIIQPQANPKS